MNSTDIAAWYAAVVATAVFLWDIVKWIRNGPRLRINAISDVVYPDGHVIEKRQIDDCEEKTLATYCHLEVLNVGGQPTTIMNIQVVNASKLNDKHVSYSGPAFKVHAGSDPLPALLGPGEIWSARIEMTSVETIANFGPAVVQITASYSKNPITAAIDQRQVPL